MIYISRFVFGFLPNLHKKSWMVSIVYVPKSIECIVTILEFLDIRLQAYKEKYGIKVIANISIAI